MWQISAIAEMLHFILWYKYASNAYKIYYICIVNQMHNNPINKYGNAFKMHWDLKMGLRFKMGSSFNFLNIVEDGY